jgi:hypothetical protein
MRMLRRLIRAFSPFQDFGAYVLAALSLLPVYLQAQTGWNAVYSNPSGQVSSYAFVDASQLGTTDICKAINTALTTYQATSFGLVIDARGMNPTGTVTCGSGGSPNPWANVPGNFPNVVLLPSGTIDISAKWVLPGKTHVIGEGPNSTTIVANFSGDIIDMGLGNSTQSPPCSSGNPPWDCQAIVIEHLGLNGSNTAANGIVNCCAQELSRVNDVFIQNVGIGLSLNDSFAQNSGPYTNISMSNVGQCVTMEPGQETGSNGASAATRGVHGLTCLTNGTSRNPAIVVDTANNTIEDIYVQGANSPTQDGISIGGNPNGLVGVAAQGNILSNIQGVNLINVVHIGGGSQAPSSSSNCPNSSTYACDVNIFAVSGSGVTRTVEDDLYTPGGSNTYITDPNVGMYVLGELVAGGAGNGTASIGYSRLTTSPSVPAWFVGPSSPLQGHGCTIGDLFSTTSTSTNFSLWECVGTSGTPWLGVK